MNRWILWLSLLLVVQLGLAILAWRGDDPYAAFTPEEKLASFQPEKVDKIQIAGDGSQITLIKQRDRWVLSDPLDFPADQQRIERLLETLAGLEKGWPVATTASAAKRFKVDASNFERHIILHQGETRVADLYFGTSPGLRKVHARVAGEKEIISVPFALFDATAERDDWIDRRVLWLDAESMVRVKLPSGIVLERLEGDGEWRLADLKADESTNRAEIERIVDKLAKLSIDGVFRQDKTPQIRKDAKPLHITIFRKEGEPLKYTFTRLEQNDYLLQRSDQSRLFRVTEWQVRPFEELERNSLVKPATAEKKEAKENQEKAAGGSSAATEPEETENITPEAARGAETGAKNGTDSGPDGRSEESREQGSSPSPSPSP